MKTTNEVRSIVAGYGAAYALMLLAYVFAFVIKGGAGESVTRLPYYSALALVIYFTFVWGRLRGFPFLSEDGHLVLSHIIRNLTMSAIVWIALIFVSAPALPWISSVFE